MIDTASLISAGKMRSDCGDIRFRDSDETTDLSYWIESGCNSGSTSIWVKVPSVPSGTKTIYMYYGNPSASSESNGVNTFLIFDDFEGTFTWTYEETHVNFEGALDSSTYVSPTKSYRLRTDGATVAVGTNYAQIKKNAAEGNVNARIKFSLRRSTTYTTSGWAENSVWFGTTKVWNQDVYPATTSFSTYEATGTLPTTGQVSLRVQGLQSDTYANWYHGGYWDNVIVRKYSSPEPIISVGTEEFVSTTTTTITTSSTTTTTTLASGIVLNPATIGFNIFPFSFTFTKLTGTQTSFSAFWDVQQPGGVSPTVGVSCTYYNGTLTPTDCLPKPFIQGPGAGSCTVQNPLYAYTKLNNVSCFVYYTPDPSMNATYNISFYPLAFNVSAGLGSLTVGRPIPLRVNVQNTGLITDNYTVNMTSPSSYISISHQLTSTGFLQGSPTYEYGYSVSDVTALASIGAQTRIDVNVCSTIKPSICQTITIKLSAGLASLPDFTIFGIIQIIVLAALILWSKK